MAEHFLDPNGRPVQAMRLDPELVTVISVWCKGLVVEEIDPFDRQKTQPGLNVPGKDEVKRASLGDWVLKHEDGSFDVSKPGIFSRTHSRWEA